MDMNFNSYKSSLHLQMISDEHGPRCHAVLSKNLIQQIRVVSQRYVFFFPWKLELMQPFNVSTFQTPGLRKQFETSV